MKKLLLAAALSLSAVAAHAADTYQFDESHTFPRFTISHLGFSHFQGRFDKTTGTATLDLAAKTGSVEATIDVASIDTGVAKLDEHLKSPDFFDVAKYPTISFTSTKLTFKGKALATVTGDLTLHGVTKPVTLTVTHFACGEHPMKKVAACGADLVGKLKRSDFGISTYVPLVGDEVALAIEVEAAKQ